METQYCFFKNRSTSTLLLRKDVVAVLCTNRLRSATYGGLQFTGGVSWEIYLFRQGGKIFIGEAPNFRLFGVAGVHQRNEDRIPSGLCCMSSSLKLQNLIIKDRIVVCAVDLFILIWLNSMHELKGIVFSASIYYFSNKVIDLRVNAGSAGIC